MSDERPQGESTRAGGYEAVPGSLVLTPVSRWPTTLRADTVRTIMELPLQPGHATPRWPRLAVAMVTRNGLAFTRLCLATLVDSMSDQAEIAVVDNGSDDGTPEFLLELSRRDRRVRVQLNVENRGFAAGTNAAVSMTTAPTIVLLNNDTVVPRGSLERLAQVLDDDSIGLVGAVTNRAGNEAEIDCSYRTLDELRAFATERAHDLGPQVFDIRTATMFCAAIRRDVWVRLGPLDERFAMGLFEDDDYSMRVRAAGYRVVCADGVFVHHFGQASIGNLGLKYGPLFHDNRARWEAKWGQTWVPYARRPRPAYLTLVDQVRNTVMSAVPAGATVLVLSKGDSDLIDLGERRGWHFPRAADGAYAGYYPADSNACIEAFEGARVEGATHFVVPEPMAWWLEHYDGFREYLRARSRIVQDGGGCLILALAAPEASGAHAEVDADAASTTADGATA